MQDVLKRLNSRGHESAIETAKDYFRDVQDRMQESANATDLPEDIVQCSSPQKRENAKSGGLTSSQMVNITELLRRQRIRLTQRARPLKTEEDQ